MIPREADSSGQPEGAERLESSRRPWHWRRPWAWVADAFSGVVEGDMLRRNGQRKRGTTCGSPRRSRTAKASRISRAAAKSRCACKWGGWGRLSVDGPRHYNSDRSEGPWGRATKVAQMAV